MPRTRAEIKAELQTEAERLIDALLDWTEQTEAPNLTQIEDEVLKLRQQFAEKLAEAAVDWQATTDPLTVKCPKCARPMHLKKKRQRRRVESRVGGVALQRAYYYCQTCRVGLFPLDQQLQVAGERWSEGLRQLAVWLDGLLTFERAESVLAKVGQVSMSDTTAWRQAQTCGAAAQALEAVQRAAATAVPDRQQIVPGETPSGDRLAVAMDGGMLPVRGEGWKELKVGGLGRIVLQPARDPVTGDVLELARTVENRYVAHLGGPAVFGQQMWAEAKARGWSQVADTVVLGDGAPWIWNLAGEHFYDSVQIVDWYHAKEHLSQAANLLHGEGTPAAKHWLKEHETILFEGHAERVADSLSCHAKGKRKVAKELRGHAGYFRDNQRRMQYLERREDDYPIGSGLAESGCKQFRSRFVGSGMRWSRTGAEHLLPVRAAIMSHRFDAFWSGLQAPPLN